MAFPQELEAAKELVEEHQQIPHEKVVFAAYYSPDGEVPYIIEVLDGFGYNDIGDDGDLMDTEFKSFHTFAKSTEERVHLVLTNPKELGHALLSEWKGVQTLREAVRHNRFLAIVPNGEIESQLRALTPAA